MISTFFLKHTSSPCPRLSPPQLFLLYLRANRIYKAERYSCQINLIEPTVYCRSSDSRKQRILWSWSPMKTLAPSLAINQNWLPMELNTDMKLRNCSTLQYVPELYIYPSYPCTGPGIKVQI